MFQWQKKCISGNKSSNGNQKIQNIQSECNMGLFYKHQISGSRAALNMEEKGLARKSTQGGGAEVEQVQQVFQLDVLFKNLPKISQGFPMAT